MRIEQIKSASAVANFWSSAAVVLSSLRVGGREAKIDERGILKVSAVSPKIKRDEGECDNRREYRDRDGPIDMLSGAASRRHNRGEGLETDFPQLAHRSAGRLIDCHESLALFGGTATLSSGPAADMARATPLIGVAELLRRAANPT